MLNLLLVEDNQDLREQMKWALADAYTIFEADTLKSAVAVCKKKEIKLVCLDMGLENQPERGMEIINELLTLNRHVQIIVITSNSCPELGPKAINGGAIDYLVKPIDIEELKVLLARASRIFDFEKSVPFGDLEGLSQGADIQIIGDCEAMKQIFDLIRRLSTTDVSVLITGESGTGKELCARAIHHYSDRNDEAFIPINCGAIPESLMESELFGYVKGAFTGANSNKMGLIESAHEGTLFLDEIGDMPVHLQVKLLRFLEDQVLQRIGEVESRSLDVRIIAATNKSNLGDEDCQAMRTDLYYRLSEFEIKLPPLKERLNDILMIAHHIVERNRVRFNQPKLRIGSQAEEVMLAYDWPGNIRELENRLNRAAIMCNSQTINVEDLQLLDTSALVVTLKQARRIFERNYLASVLHRAKGNVTVAAKKAGVSRPTFYELMKKNDVPSPEQYEIERKI